MKFAVGLIVTMTMATTANAQLAGILNLQNDARATRDRILGNIAPGTYGQRVSSDQFGRPVYTDPGVQLELNAYGLGVHSDQFGNAIRCHDQGARVVCK